VFRAQGDFYFQQKRLLLAAKYYALSSLPLEDVVMQFQFESPLAAMVTDRSTPGPDDIDSELKNTLLLNDALRTYLTQKMKLLQMEDATQRTLLAMWILELFLKKISLMRKDHPSELQQCQSDFDAWIASPAIQVHIQFHDHVSDEYKLFFLFLCFSIEDFSIRRGF
jgi:hypothetical protein